MRIPRRAAASLAAAALLALSACGGAQEEAPADPGSVPAASGDDVSLRVWFPGNLPDEMTLINDEIVPAFESETGVKVEVEFVEWGDLATRLSTAFAGGTAPDIFGHGNAAAAGYFANERVLSLDSYLDAMPADEVEDLVFRDQGVVDGEQAIMPLRGFGHLLAYRTDFFIEAGLDPETPPTNWSELRSAAEALTVKDGDKLSRAGIVLPADDPTSMAQAFGSFLYQAGGEFVDDSGAVAWNSEAGKKALEFHASLYDGGSAVATGLGEQLTGAGAQHPLATGRAAMAVIDESTLQSIHEQAPDVAASIAVAPPLADAEVAQFGGAAHGLFISADTEHPDEAWSFIEFMLQPENAKAYVQAVGGIPARQSLVEDEELSQLPYIAPYMDAAASFRGNPNIEKWTQVRDVLTPHIEAALRGVTPPAEALDQAAEEAAAVLEED